MAIPRNLANIAPHANASSTEFVINDGSADLDFRVESDGNANMLFVDAGNNRVGIGVASPGSILSIASSSGIATTYKHPSNNADFYISNYNDADGNQAYLGSNLYVDSSGNLQRGDTGKPSAAINIAGRTGDGYIRFYTGSGAATERARITSDGYFKASNNGTYQGATDTWHEFNQSANGSTFVIRNSNASFTGTVLNVQATRDTTNGSYNYIVGSCPGVATRFIVADSGNVTNTNGSYGTISDVKLKQDIVDATPQWNDIKNLRFRKYRLKEEVQRNPDAKFLLGLIAQEAELVSPGLIEDQKDTEEIDVPVLDDDGNPVLDENGNPQTKKETQFTGTVTKAIKTSILYMKAVKALQEAQLRIETLETQNAAFEARLAALEAK